MMYKLCDNPWDGEEIKAIQDVIDSDMYTMGDNVKRFETEFAKKVGSRHAIMVNSGSSANLLAIAGLVYSGKLPRGSEVIVPAVSWSTTYSPLEQYGMKLVFVDIDKDTLNIDTNILEKSITSNTKMIFSVNLLGNANNFSEIKRIVAGRDIFVIEDNCESLGGKYQGKYLGTLGVVGTFSTFYSHHICTMEGGVVVTDDDCLYEYMLAVRAHGWTRNISKDSGIYTKKDQPFYESFNFIVPGYNIRPLEMEGAIGCKQLLKIDGMIKNRRENAKHFVEKMQYFQDIQIQTEVGESSWFGFAIILKGNLKGKRDSLVRILNEKGIEVRPIVAGNFTRNSVIKYFDYTIPYELDNANYIHDNGFFIGNHSHNNFAEIDYFAEVLQNAIAEL